jgi:hypothetical protein
MLQTILIFASEGEEPSKTAFYILGGLLVAWALTLTAVGMRSETFPQGIQAQRGVIGVSAVLVVATMVTTIVTA